MKTDTPSERMRQIHEAFDEWLKKADPHNLFVTSHGFAREAWQDATLSVPSERGLSLPKALREASAFLMERGKPTLAGDCITCADVIEEILTDDAKLK